MSELLTFYHSHSSFIYPMGKKNLTTGIYYFVIRNNYRRKDICFGGAAAWSKQEDESIQETNSKP